MSKRRKQFTIETNEELVLDEMHEINDAEEIENGDDLDDAFELDVLETDSDRDEDDETIDSLDTKEDDNVSIDVAEIDVDELDSDFSDYIDEDQLEGELDVDFDIEDKTDEAESEVEGTESTEKSTILPPPSQGVRENLFPKSTLSFESIRASVTNPVKRFGDAGILSIVNSKNGTRLALSKELYDKLDLPDSVQFGFIENELIVGKTIGDDYTNYDLKSQGAKQIIYCKELIAQVTESYSLDFSNRSSITVHEATYEMLNDNVIARIKMN